MTFLKVRLRVQGFHDARGPHAMHYFEYIYIYVTALTQEAILFEVART